MKGAMVSCVGVPLYSADFSIPRETAESSVAAVR